ncbi:MAG: hypothetical protein FJX37_11870, partial [Alphaproteobacteria bacterium]|nr:hypothetical protein [Alphaproteobacteria bacterium]
DGGAVADGDRIVTSGHGGLFPPGLPIGVVVSVSDNGVLVKPFVERSQLDFVRVVDFGLVGILEGPPPPRVEPAQQRRSAVRKEAAKRDEGAGR